MGILKNAYVNVNKYTIKVKNIQNYSTSLKDFMEGLIFLMRLFDAEICEFQVFADTSRWKNVYVTINKCAIKVKSI